MKNNQAFYISVITIALALTSCAQPNKPVQTASEYEPSGQDSSGSNASASSVDSSSIRNTNNLPQQLVPENSSITISPQVKKQ